MKKQISLDAFTKEPTTSPNTFSYKMYTPTSNKENYFISATGQIISRKRQAKKKLMRELGVTGKRLRKLQIREKRLMKEANS